MNVDVQVASEDTGIPDENEIRDRVIRAVRAIDPDRDVEVSVRIVDEAEMQNLNRDYRGRDKPTNVLAFEAGLPAELGLPDLGDVIICRDVVHREASEQRKPLDAHWAHMVVHGTLHLLGFDHADDPQASEMEAAEVQILAGLGYSDPYHFESQQHARTGPADNG